jgi:signal transduction histidine kinase/DNA-binding NarL/FixJ family response regulator
MAAAAQAGVALGRARSLQETHQRVSELATVNSISQALGTELDLDALIELVGEQMRRTFKADIVYVALHDRRSNLIHFPYEYGEKLETIRFGEGLTSRILESGQPLLINEDIEGRHTALQTQQIGVQAKSYLGVPIVVGNEAIGVISVQSTTVEGRFDEADVRLLSTIAANVGIAIENARLYTAAQEAKAAAEAANQAKSAFLSTVSHELRTPLTSVLGFAKVSRQTLENKLFPHIQTDDPKVQRQIRQIKENLQIIVSEGERLTTLINNVLDLAKIEAGKVEWQMQPLAISSVIDRATTATAALFEKKGLALVKDVAADLPEVVGDQDKLIQVVINLISNAVKFTERGSVTCQTRLDNSDIVISVIDTGLGIAPQDQPKVFEKFKQVGDTLTDKPKGTGLGLPICKEIVEHHGGSIWVESEPGRGSTFSFTVPVPGSSGPERHLSIRKEALLPEIEGRVGRAEGDIRVLVVDDDPAIRSLLRQELEEKRYKIDEAENATEAITKARAIRPDLMLLDVMMPDLSGYDVLRVLKNDEITKGIPVIIISALEDKSKGTMLGAADYITKPVDEGALMGSIENALRQRDTRKQCIAMVIEGDPNLRRDISGVMKARDFDVIECGGDMDGIVSGLRRMPDLILVDPEIFKSQVAEALKQDDLKGVISESKIIYLMTGQERPAAGQGAT